MIRQRLCVTTSTGPRIGNSLTAVMLAATLSGCASMGLAGAQPVMPAKPAKPSLPSLSVTPDGGITLGRRDTERLMKYIIELERGYE